MAALLTPAQFADKYLSMQVYIYPPESKDLDNSSLAPQGWQTVSVANYKLTLSPFRDTIWNSISSKLGDKTTVKLRTIGGQEVEDSLTPAQCWNAFRFPWAGKGSPEQAQIAIQLVYRFHKAKTALTAFLAQDFVGLDCNGFAGNYYQRVMQGTDWNQQNNMKDIGPTTYIEGLLWAGGRGGELKSLDKLDTDGTYVLAECNAATGAIAEPDGNGNYGHVMLTEPSSFKKLANGKITLSVSEATADGDRKLRTGVNYTFYPGKTVQGVTVFHVERGAATDTLDVRMAKFAV